MTRAKFKSFIIDKWPAKVLSIAAAVVLYFIHSSTSSTKERFFLAPLKIEQSGSMAPANDDFPRTVRVTLRGSSDDVQTVLDNDIETYIDLENPTEKGIAHYPIQIRKTGTALETGTLEISVKPAEITLDLDERMFKFVNVTPRTKGSPAAGYMITDYSVNPSRIRIDGPERLVSRITEISTDLIDIAARNADFTVITRAVNTDPLITIQGDSVIEYRAEVKPFPGIRNIDNVPIAAENLAPYLEFSADPPALSLRIEGPEVLLTDWIPVITKTAPQIAPSLSSAGAPSASLDFSAQNGEALMRMYTRSVLYVDCAGITAPGDYSLEVKVDLPPDFKILETANHATALSASLLPSITARISAAQTSRN